MYFKIAISTLVGAAVWALPAYTKTPVSTDKDAAFLAMAALADMTMAHVGQMAQDRAQSGSVKAYGKTLAQDHTGDYQKLSELAAKTGENIPKAIDRQNDRTISALDHYRGKTFDHAFLARQSTEHEKLINAFKREAEHGSNPAIKEYANKTLPTIERHLHDAQDLIKQRS
jgi:putative membrane protein